MKIFDFGFVKYVMSSHVIILGKIKGMFSYLSSE